MEVGWRGLLAAPLCLFAILPLSSAARPSSMSEYRGHITATRNQAVSLSVREGNGRNTRAVFSVDRVELICDSAFRRRSFGPTRLRFVTPGVFEGQRYRRLGDGNWSYYEVKGRLLRDGRAKGYIYYLQDSYGPTETSGPTCTSGGQLYLTWRARRTPR